jgi:hypothetical protein
MLIRHRHDVSLASMLWASFFAVNGAAILQVAHFLPRAKMAGR